jgi:hypothetical protein
MEAGFEFVLWIATDVFGQIFGSGKRWWVKLLLFVGCLAATLLVTAALIGLVWWLISHGGEVS